MTTILTRDQILGADDIQTETVDVPEWGGSVLVRGLSGTERDALEAEVVQANNDGSTSLELKNLRARLVSLSVVDEDGERLFSDRDVEMLGQKSAHALQRVFAVAQRLSGLQREDIEELTKN